MARLLDEIDTSGTEATIAALARATWWWCLGHNLSVIGFGFAAFRAGDNFGFHMGEDEGQCTCQWTPSRGVPYRGATRCEQDDIDDEDEDPDDGVDTSSYSREDELLDEDLARGESDYEDSFHKPTVDVPATTLHAPIAPGERPLSEIGRIAFEMPPKDQS